MKFIPIILILAVLAYVIFAYVGPMFAPHSSPCPAGTTYARSIMGGAWTQTDASDPFGKCVPNSEIDMPPVQ